MTPGRVAASVLLLWFAVPAAGGTARSGSPAGLVGVRDRASALCQLVGVVMRARRIDDAVAFVGSGTPDTLLAGPGPVQYRPAPGDSARGRRPAIYGQIVRVERLDRAATARLGESLASARNEAVIVPWSFDASCVPIPWESSARWLDPGSAAMVLGRLREPAHWVGGRPTFDITPGADTYHGGGATPDSILSPADFLSLYERLPTYTQLATSPDSAIAPVLSWRREHPDLAHKPVARELIDQLVFEAEEARYKLRASPVAGTYRVVYHLPSGDSVAFFARTERYPDFVNSRSARDSGVYRGRRIVGHGIRAQADRTIAELPVRTAPHGRGHSLQGSIEILDAPVAVAADSAIYSGTITLDWAAQLLAPNEQTGAALQAAAKRAHEIGHAQYERTDSGYLGRFVVARDGRVRYEMRVDSAGAHVMTVRAERISDTYMSPRDQ